VCGKRYTFYLQELPASEEALFDVKEQVLDPLRRFLGGSQREIYDQARRFLQEEDANFAHIEGQEAQQLRALLDDPACYLGPSMQQAKSLTDSLRARVAQKVLEERAQALRRIGERWQRLSAAAEFDDLEAYQQAELQRPFTDLAARIENQTLVAVIRDTLQNFDLNDYNRLLTRMNEMSSANRSAQTGGSGNGVSEPHVQYVPQQTIKPAFPRAWLADEKDIDDYLRALKDALMAAIQEGKRVQL
jgi:hypothetical protein